MFDNFKQILKIVWRALLSNKTRSFLTMLGIIIGVGAVILIMSLGAGAQHLILSQVDSFGSDLIGILPGQSDENGPPAMVFGIKVTSLKDSDAVAIKNRSNVPSVTAVASYYETNVSAYYRDSSYDTKIEGVSGDYLEIERAEISSGRFFTTEEMGSINNLVVLGSAAATELFGDSDPIGRQIRVKNRNMQVIGVLKSRGVSGFSTPDDSIFAPLRFVQKEIAGVDYLTYIRAKVDDEKNIDEAMAIISQLLRERHGFADPEDDDFSVRSFRDALDVITGITNAMSIFLAAMAAISLLVGGIGIMNIMLVSVTERTREIGLRKSLGATSRNVRSQFLLEAVMLTLLGGLIGLVGGSLVSYLVSVVVESLGYDWAFIVSWLSIVLAIGISALVGVIFGYYPAKRASMLNPIDALRYE